MIRESKSRTACGRCPASTTSRSPGLTPTFSSSARTAGGTSEGMLYTAITGYLTTQLSAMGALPECLPKDTEGGEVIVKLLGTA